MTLTKEGEFLYNKLSSSYDSMCKNIEYARTMQSKPNKTIRIGYPSTYDCSEDYDKLKQLINEYAAQNPEIELNEMLYDFLELKNALTYGNVDIVFTHDFILREMPNISIKNVCRARMCLAMSVKHPLASMGSLKDISISDLENETFYSIPFSDDSSDKKRSYSGLSVTASYQRMFSSFKIFSRLSASCVRARG